MDFPNKKIERAAFKLEDAFMVLQKDVLLLNTILDIKHEEELPDGDRDLLVHIYNALSGISDIPYLTEHREIPDFIVAKFLSASDSYELRDILKMARKIVSQLARIYHIISDWKTHEDFKQVIATLDNDEFDHWVNWVDKIRDAFERSTEIAGLIIEDAIAACDE